MNPNLIVVATSFHVGAFLLGLPALAVSLLYAFFRVHLWMSPPTAPLEVGKNPDAILLPLGVFARVLGGLMDFLGGLGKMVFGVIAVASLVALLYAVALWFTSRGLQTQARWARGMVTVPTLLSLLGLTVFRGPAMILALLVCGAGLFALRTLWIGFGT